MPSTGAQIHDGPFLYHPDDGSLVGYVNPLTGQQANMPTGVGAPLQAGSLAPDPSTAPNAQAVVNAVNGVASLASGKQDPLTAGTGITIVGNVISATGGGGVGGTIDGGDAFSSSPDIIDGGSA